MLLRLLFFILLSFYQIDAQCFTLPNDTRIVSGSLNSNFNVMSMLPGKYDRITVGTTTTTFKDGNCSTALFGCIYQQILPNQAVVYISGSITNGLDWITFTTSNAKKLMPISVAFFPNNEWIDKAPGSLQPKALSPFAINTLGQREQVTFSCDVQGELNAMSVLVNFRGTPMYTTNESGIITLDDRLKFPQIISLTDTYVAPERKIEITVKKFMEIDLYGCTNGKNTMTYVIDWLEPKPSGATSQCLLAMEALLGAAILRMI